MGIWTAYSTLVNWSVLRGISASDTHELLSIECGSGNLITNSASLAVLGDCLARGGAPLLSSPDALKRASTEASSGWDGVFLSDACFTQAGWSNFGRFSPRHEIVRRASTEEGGLVGWWGVGGQLFLHSTRRQLTFAFQSTYLPFNWVGADIAAWDVVAAVLECAPQK